MVSDQYEMVAQSEKDGHPVLVFTSSASDLLDIQQRWEYQLGWIAHAIYPKPTSYERTEAAVRGFTGMA